ncbi:MAG TPA: GNVR domain-containing protein [Pyrinomonadaceae bacterium]|jgi:polysaccharide chain length determinant protein (PEP-CTERM system associated)|nr:GNVR domain-containing protein [Pyrinomonadaceae bacterium]
MSVQFRQRTPGEYLKILKRRKWLIILPVIAVATAVGYVVYRLPDVYESSTLIVVKPSTLPTSTIPTVAEDGLTRQLSSISQVVGSRSSLEPLVQKYDLYRLERQRGEPMESVIDIMRDAIRVEVNKTRQDITDGFDIAFRYRDPKIAQAVTAELAGKYISAQTANTINSTAAARQFIDAQVLQTKQELDQIDQKRLDFMQANLGTLPSEAESLLSQLTGLRDQEKTLISEIGRLQDRRSTLSTQLGLLQKQTEQNIGEVAENMTDPKTTLAWAELVKRKADLQAELQHMLTELKPKHPDVLAKQAQLESVQKDMDEQIGEWKERVAEKEKRLKGRPDLGAAAVQGDIKLIDNEIKRQQKSLGENQQAIATITDRINRVPGSDVQLGAIEREYQTKKAAYDKLLSEQQKIALGADAAAQQQGEGIEVIDPANLPAKPVAPKRLMFAVMGIVAGLALGLLLTAIFEIPLLMTIQSTEDARHYTGLPVLIAVPELLTPQEARSLPRRRRLLLAAGVIATIVSIPLLALALRLTHVFEFLMQSSGRSA